MLFHFIVRTNGTLLCVTYIRFYSNNPDSVEDDWSQSGCVLNPDLSNSTQSVCECNHLTHFAILLSPGAHFSKAHSFALRVIGYVGVSISEVAMLATIIVLVLFTK